MSLIELTKLSPAQFPTTEDDEFEFKSSKMSWNEFKKELNKAGSGFANSGGGCLIWGVEDNTGDPDGGVDPQVGNQDLSACMDKIIHNVDPPLNYEIRLYDNNEARGSLDTGKVIAAVSIHPSDSGPHMADDKRYYIRAGKHTVPAGHFLVEAIAARRQVGKPILTPVIRPRRTGQTWSIDLGVINLTNTPAIDVVLDVLPKRGFLKDHEKCFPIELPVVDQANPFYMFFEYVHAIKATLSGDVSVNLAYRDIAGNEYTSTNTSSLIDSLPPNIRQWAD